MRNLRGIVMAAICAATLSLTACGAGSSDKSTVSADPLANIRTGSTPKSILPNVGASLTCDDNKVRRHRTSQAWTSSEMKYTTRRGRGEDCTISSLAISERKTQGAHQMMVVVMVTPESIYTSRLLQGDVKAKNIRFPDDSTLVVLVQDAYTARGRDAIQQETEEPDGRALQAVRSSLFASLTR